MVEQVCAGCSSSDELWAIMANSGAVHILQYNVDSQGVGHTVSDAHSELMI